MHLYDLGRAFRRTVPQVVTIDSQHLVVVPQFSILGRQTAGEEVQDKDAALFRLTDEFDAERLRALALHQRHLQHCPRVAVGGRAAVGTDGGRGGLGRGGGGARRSVVIGSSVPRFEALLLHDCESEEGRLPQHQYGPGVGDRRQSHVIDLDTHQSQKEELYRGTEDQAATFSLVLSLHSFIVSYKNNTCLWLLTLWNLL